MNDIDYRKWLQSLQAGDRVVVVYSQNLKTENIVSRVNPAYIFTKSNKCLDESFDRADGKMSGNSRSLSRPYLLQSNICDIQDSPSPTVEVTPVINKVKPSFLKHKKVGGKKKGKRK